VGAGQGITFNGRDWSKPSNIDVNSNNTNNNLYAVSCASSSFCAAVDENGQELTYNGTSWSRPTTIAGVTASDPHGNLLPHLNLLHDHQQR
jgi:hypothetical protein